MTIDEEEKSKPDVEVNARPGSTIVMLVGEDMKAKGFIYERK